MSINRLSFSAFIKPSLHEEEGELIVDFLGSVRRLFSNKNFFGSSPDLVARIQEAKERAWASFEGAVQEIFSSWETERVYKRYALETPSTVKSRKEALSPFYVRCFALALQEKRQAAFLQTSEKRVAAQQDGHTLLTDSRMYERFKNLFSKKSAILERDFERFILLHNAETLTPFQYYEILTTKVSNSSLETRDEARGISGTLLPSPNGKYYEIYQKIEKKMILYILRPREEKSGLQTLFLFQPTQLRGDPVWIAHTIADDLGDWPGKDSYYDARDEIMKALNDPAILPPGEKAVALGFSLGGSLASYLVADFPEKFSAAYFFKHPGIDPKINHQFLGKMQKLPPGECHLTLYQFFTVGDLAGCIGQEHLGDVHAEVRPEQLNVETYTMVPEDPNISLERAHRGYVLVQNMPYAILMRETMISYNARPAVSLHARGGLIERLRRSYLVGLIRRFFRACLHFFIYLYNYVRGRRPLGSTSC
jgi:hypothetical protein